MALGSDTSIGDPLERASLSDKSRGGAFGAKGPMIDPGPRTLRVLRNRQYPASVQNHKYHS